MVSLELISHSKTKKYTNTKVAKWCLIHTI